MRRTTSLLTVIGAAALGLSGVVAAPAQAADSDVTVIASGLNGPRELQFVSGRKLVVAESDNGQITAVDSRSGKKKVLATGLVAPQGVDSRGSALYVAEGEASGPGGEPVPGGGGTDLVMVKGGHDRQVKDLMAYELANNPDGQVQFVDGQPVDALSNPYYVLADTSKVLVADAGANDVLKIDRRTGRTSVWFLPPVVTTGACAGAENNPGTTGCDPVPTGIAKAGDGTYWVSTLGAEAPGAGRIYHVDAAGHIIGMIDGLTAPTGVAVDGAGSVYVSDLLFGAPEGDGPPPPDFDPSKVGRILKFAADGTPMGVAQVTMPSGLVWHDGALYASAWSVGIFLGIPDAGQVVKVGQGAFEQMT
ncbi:hypothetical protein CLV35_0103 [Motilibacter peucedani]|uniref:ScyD/ScyE family protein n=1 Tax=Motilibacter peucedani TaxID=598650 RepID=A0A420XVG0_9ACTN|nr:ScyD/ScyE family protein [Motilibacter peucedani]RKS84286.1 hypothetical protein CLV35_0103 [Motilibacter peucedani]